MRRTNACHVNMFPAATVGFTLIELLVVISIISMLIAIAMPSLSRARANAKVTACASNLGQLGLAVTTYANENEGLIPRGPASAGPFDFACAQVATNQLWIGSGDAAHSSRHNGLGLLLNGYSQLLANYNNHSQHSKKTKFNVKHTRIT